MPDILLSWHFRSSHSMRPLWFKDSHCLGHSWLAADHSPAIQVYESRLTITRSCTKFCVFSMGSYYIQTMNRMVGNPGKVIKTKNMLCCSVSNRFTEWSSLTESFWTRHSKYITTGIVFLLKPFHQISTADYSRTNSAKSINCNFLSFALYLLFHTCLWKISNQ